MKCNNCGINYDDDDRECPICGTRAGAGGRASVPRYTSYIHDTHSADDCTHRSFTREFTTSKRPAAKTPRPVKAAPDSKKSGKWIGVAIAAFILLAEILPVGLRFVQEQIDDLRYSIVGAYAPADSYAVPEPDYAPAYGQEIVADLLGAWSTGTAPDGGLLSLSLDADNDYALTYENGDLLYEETGWAWCVYNEPSEGLYDEAYPPARYDSYTLCLELEETPPSQGGLPESLAAHRDIGEMWMLIYIPLDGGDAVLHDIYGECTAFFGGAEFLPMQVLEQG